MFYFNGVKYGIPQPRTIGYDAVVDVRYDRPSASDNTDWWISLRARARKKGDTSTYSTRLQFNWRQGSWSLRTTADANYVSSYGVSLAQDIAYDFHHAPVSLRTRLQAFDAREWANRIYLYEHDVRYSFSIPACYGVGGRAYLYLKWQIVDQLALYLRVSETVYAPQWARLHDRAMTRTDIHLLLRARL